MATSTKSVVHYGFHLGLCSAGGGGGGGGEGEGEGYGVSPSTAVEVGRQPQHASAALPAAGALGRQQQQQQVGGQPGARLFALSASPLLHRPLTDRAGCVSADFCAGHRCTSNARLPAGSVPAPSAANVAAHSYGWKGLVEMSRSSASAGIVGARKSMAVFGDAQIEVCATSHINAPIRRLIKSVVRGLRACQEPEAPADGMGGTYFFPNEAGRKAAILKPCDEEPLAPNNPKGYVGRQLGDPGWKPTVRVGEAAMREVAAHLLDHGGFARVPTSVLVRARHPAFCYTSRTTAVMRAASAVWGSTADLAALAGSSPPSGGDGSRLLPMKLGSLQEYVGHECDTSEMGPSRFAAADVHRIGILDIRLFNTDRHAGNMLVRPCREAGGGSGGAGLSARTIIADSQYELVPIDHGFCLPETLDAPYFEWLHWPQAMLPFSDDELAYIRSLDAAADRELLARELPVLRPECVRVLELTTALLQRCAGAGMTLYEIGSILSRPYEGGDEAASELERMCARAKRVFARAAASGSPSRTVADSVCECACAPLPAMSAAGQGAPAAALPQPEHRQSSNGTGAEELMFELEGDGGMSRVSCEHVRSGCLGVGLQRRDHQPSPVTFESGSPSHFSTGSSPPLSSVSSAQLRAEAEVSEDSRTVAGAAVPGPTRKHGCGGPAAASASASAPPPPPQAHSVVDGGGFMWRMGMRKSVRSGTRTLRRSRQVPLEELASGDDASGDEASDECVMCGAGPQEPAGVCAASSAVGVPSSAAQLTGTGISFAEFDEKGWASFKETVLSMVGAAIADGRWQRSVGVLASSCGAGSWS